MKKCVLEIDLYFRSTNGVDVNEAKVKREEWEDVKSYIKYLEEQVSYAGWKAAAQHAAYTGGWQ